MTDNIHHKPPHTLTIMILISLAAVIAVLPSSTIPVLTHYFQVSGSTAQSIISVYLLGYVIGQLIYGPVANRFGYRHAMVIGFSICLVGLLVCFLSYYAHSFPLLLFGRFLSVMGSSSCLVCGFIMIDDQFDRQRARSMIGFAVFALNVGSNIAISVGSIVTEKLNWGACYLVLFVYTLFALYVASRVKPNKLFINKDALRVKQIVRGYINSFSSRQLVAYGLMLSLSASASYLYAAAAPLIALNQLHISQLTYSWWNLLNIVGLIAGLWVVSRFSDRFNEQQFLRFSVPAFLALGICMLLFMYSRTAPFYLFFMISCALYFVSTLIYPNASTLALASYDKKGDASATMTFLNVGNTTVMVSVMALMPGHSGWEYGQMLILLAAIGFVLLAVSQPKTVAA